MPLYIEMGVKKPKKYYINLNNYRNWHYQVSNALKARYKAILAPKVKGLTFGVLTLTFTLYKGDRRRVDRSNILSIHEKFFCDGLTACSKCDLGICSGVIGGGCEKNILDDNDSFLESSHYYTGGIDKANPRVEIELIERKH